MLKFTQLNKLQTSKDFHRVFSCGKKKYYNGLTIVALANNFKMPRLGFAISKKQIKKAVQRNLIKRVAKEAFRNEQNQLSGVDYIVLVNKTCLNYSKKELSYCFQQALKYSAKQCA